MNRLITLISSVLFILIALSCDEDLSPKEPTVLNTSTENILTIGSTPDVLAPYLGDIAAKRFQTITNYNQVPDVLPASVVINSDEVANAAELVTSPLMEALINKGVRIVVGRNNNPEREKALVRELGGFIFEGSSLTMVQQRGDTTSTAPVALATNNKYNGYLPIDELAMMISGPGQENEDDYTEEEESIKNGRVGATEETTGTEATTVSCDFKNIAVKNRIGPGGGYKRYPGGTNNLYFSKKYQYYDGYIRTIENQPVVTYITSGSGQITFRQTTIVASDNTYTYSSDVKVSAGVTMSGFVKASAWYSNTKSTTTSYSSQYTTGATNYSNSCKYACCNAIGQYALRQGKYRRVGVSVGNVRVVYRACDECQFIPRTYCYDRNNKLMKVSYIFYGTPFIDLMIYNREKGCKNTRKTCNAAKSCSGDRAPK